MDKEAEIAELIKDYHEAEKRIVDVSSSIQLLARKSKRFSVQTLLDELRALREQTIDIAMELSKLGVKDSEEIFKLRVHHERDGA